MAGALRRNMSGHDFCVWCDNDGWLYLHRYVTRKNSQGGTYREQVIAPCGFCEQGHAKHARLGGPWNYRREEIDITFDSVEMKHLTPEEQAAYRTMRAASQAFAARQNQMQLEKPRIPALDAAGLDPGPGPDTLGEQGPDGQDFPPDTDRNEELSHEP